MRMHYSTESLKRKGETPPLGRIPFASPLGSPSGGAVGLLSHYSIPELYGKSIKDKRGGDDNIHSWDIELKGPVSAKQKQVLNKMLKIRRQKRWAIEYGIDWMDGMPLTLNQIKTFCDFPDLEDMLEDLVHKGYLVKEHPKKKVGNKRVQDETLPLGLHFH